MTRDTMRTRPLAVRHPGYQVFMLALCVYALVIMALRVALPISESTRTILEYADNAVCVLFLVDFILSLYVAPDRWTYLRTWGWLDLLSAIPMVDMARWGRAA